MRSFRKEQIPPDRLFDFLHKQPEGYIFKGLLFDWKLRTTLERAIEKSGLSLKGDAANIEVEMIRLFQRSYDGDDRDLVRRDILYCLSLMRHHGSPTRLLDCTYSVYIAAYFALQYANDDLAQQYAKIALARQKNVKTKFAIWRINSFWADTQSRIIAGNTLVSQRGEDEKRNDASFVPLYMSDEPKRFALNENPYIFHKRLIAQQSVFLCPGDVSIPFEKNLMSMCKYDDDTNVVKYYCEMNSSEIQDTLNKFLRMNLSRATLFPGLDGFAQSMEYRLPFLNKLYEQRTNKQLNAIDDPHS